MGATAQLVSLRGAAPAALERGEPAAEGLPLARWQDDLLPLLIYALLRAAPEHPHLTVVFIERFRDPDRLIGEEGYLLCNFAAACAFLADADASHFSGIERDEFRRQLEAGGVSPDEQATEPDAGSV